MHGRWKRVANWWLSNIVALVYLIFQVNSIANKQIKPAERIEKGVGNKKSEVLTLESKAAVVLLDTESLEKLA